MIRMYQRKLGVSSLILLLCAGVNSASAAAIHWTPATHQILQADFNHDGTPDLLLQAKTSAGKHYLVTGRSAGDPRYDFSKSIALPDRLNNLIWSQDKFQLLALPTREGKGSAMLAIAQNGSNALLFSRIDDSTAWSKPHQIYEPKQHKWLRSADSARYFSGDFNGDGKVDLLQLDSHHGEHQIILAEKNNRFEVAKKLSKTVQWGLKNNERLIIRDFNRDGQDDVFALSRHGKQPHTLLYSNGKGGFDKDDGKFISVNQAHLVWTDNASGITAVTRKSDKQTVLFRAYNQSERNKASERCLGWVFDTEANVAKEYCPDLNKGNGLESLAAVDDIELNDCPIEMSVDNVMTSFTPCDNGIILPTTPTSAPQVSSGPHTPGAQLSVLLANTWDNRAFTYQVWALDSSGSYHHLGDTAAPHGYDGADSVTINLSINTPGTYGLMYRGCNYDGCSGFGPSRSISIQQPVISHPVLTTASMGGQISPENPRIIQGQTATFHLTASEGYNILPVMGNCGGNTAQNPYTTAPINAPCQVFAHFARKSYTVTSTAGVGGVISPTPSIPIQHGDRATFTVTPNEGYRILSVLGCNGILSGRTYTTGPITASCSVSATFERLSYSVNSMTDGGGTISPTPVTVVLHGDTATFTVTPGIGKEVAAIKGCDGSRNGNSYKTVPITRACDVQATFTAKTYTVTATAGANGSITPPNRLVPHGQTTTFTVTPNVGYSPTVSNNCGGGSMSGTTFTVGPVTGHCAVSASFNLQSYTVSTTAGANGSISAGKTVNHGQSTTFTVTPNPGYTASATGCDGTLSGTTYTTGAITGTCNVQATFTANTYTVTATAGANGSITPPSRSVPHGQTTTFTVTPNAGFTAAANGCGGSLSGTTYTTGVITGACTVQASFAVDNTAQTIYLHTDALGSVILETDASGQVKKRTEYKPFGESKDN